MVKSLLVGYKYVAFISRSETAVSRLDISGPKRQRSGSVQRRCLWRSRGVTRIQLLFDNVLRWNNTENTKKESFGWVNVLRTVDDRAIQMETTFFTHLINVYASNELSWKLLKTRKEILLFHLRCKISTHHLWSNLDKDRQFSKQISRILTTVTGL